MTRSIALLALLLLGATCGDTVGDRTEIALRVAGTAPEPIAQGDITIELTRAELGFGPLVLCTTTGADLDLCPVAQAELRESVTIDALDPEVHDAGTIDAITGTVRSAAYDYGRSYRLTRSAPNATEGAPSGHSLLLELDAMRGEESRRLIAAIDVDPPNPGDPAVRGAPTEHAITAATRALVVHVDAHAWASHLDVAPLFESDDEVVLALPGDPIYEALVAAMTSTDLPAFEWVDE